MRKPKHNVRNALPPLHDKEVELISITKQNMVFDIYSVRLTVDGLPYQVLKGHCRDELDVLVWLAKLQTKKEQTNVYIIICNAGRNEHLCVDRSDH